VHHLCSFMEREYNETTMPRDPLLEMDLAGLDQQANSAGVHRGGLQGVGSHLEHIAKWRRESIPVNCPNAPPRQTLHPAKMDFPKEAQRAKAARTTASCPIHTVSWACHWWGHYSHSLAAAVHPPQVNPWVKRSLNANSGKFSCGAAGATTVARQLSYWQV
jgi:hypothetical protein